MLPRQYVNRYAHNPILSPLPDHAWESQYVLNPTAIEIDGLIYLLYRAVGTDNTSVIGLAVTRDGLNIDERLPDPIYLPRASFEQKAGGATDNSGCEDARIVRIGDRLFITYTAYNSVDPPRVAVSSIRVADFLARQWDEWAAPELISPTGIDDKDACIVPRQVNGQYLVLHRIDHHVCGDFVPDLDFGHHKLARCNQLFGPRPGSWDSLKVGIAGPPFETNQGWILLYHGVGDDGHYRLGAALLDRHNPTKVIGRTAAPIMAPIEAWETCGWVPNVVFPCGQIIRDGVVYIYYGGADQVIGVATIKLAELMALLVSDQPPPAASPLLPAGKPRELVTHQ